MKETLTIMDYNQVRRTAYAYATQILEFVNQVVDGESFRAKAIKDHSKTYDYLTEASNEYKENNKRIEYISQSLINEVYFEYYKTLVEYDLETGKQTLYNIVDDIDKFIERHIDIILDRLKPATQECTLLGYRKEFLPHRTEFETDQSGEVNEVDVCEHTILYIKGPGATNYMPDAIYALDMYETQDSCYSGWCNADFGNCECTRVIRPEITAKPKDEFKVIQIPYSLYNDEMTKLEVDDTMTIEELKIDNICEVDYDGGDYYYPCGNIEFNMDAFEAPCIRQKEKAQVWIFKGESGLGKTFIGNRIKNLDVFETDAHEELPEDIVASVIVMGNKYKHTIEDIEKRLVFEHDTILVDFSSK